MAAEKKKTDKKVEKKLAKTAVTSAKAVVKKVKGKAGDDNTSFIVPKGGQIIKYFTLLPALPSRTAPGDWKFTEVGCPADIDNLTIGFEDNPSPLEREFERAILVISMDRDTDPKPKGTWRFALGGVATDQADEDPSNDVAVDVIDNGFTLLVYVQVLAAKNTENIPFRFVASYTDNKTGVVAIYESQDPGITPVRPY